MANRTLAAREDGEPSEDGVHERSAAGQPGLLFTMEDWDGGMKAGESCVIAKDCIEFPAPVSEWLAQLP